MEINRTKRRKSVFFLALAAGLLVFAQAPAALATGVDRVALCNVEAAPGKTIKTDIVLEGTEPEEREGFWYTYYKETEGDDAEKVDITSWISFTPENFTLKEGETKTFTVEIKVPRNAKPGLYGATTKEACREGRSAERRSYLAFKDTIVGGNVYSGFLIPVSVEVAPSKSVFARVFNFAAQNALTILLVAVIAVLGWVVLKRRGGNKRETSDDAQRKRNKI